MKTLKTLALSALVLAGAVQASAQTVIRIVASNGDRTATQTAISNLFGSTAWRFQGISGHAVYDGSSFTAGNLATATGANFGAWNGTYSGSPVIIKVSFSGALAGIAAVAGNLDQRFVATDGTGTGVVANPLTSTNPADFEVAKADFGFSTNFQSTSPFNGAFQGVTYSTIVEEIVGVSPLGFYASPGFPGTPVNPHGTGYEHGTYKPNITTQLAQLLYTTGSLSLAQFTGDYGTHTNYRVYAIGRNTDAGQRFGAYTEVGLGTTTNVTVWFPAVNGATTASGITYGGNVTSHQLWPVNQQPGTFAVPLGSGGYNSGANLAAVLTVALNEAAYKGNFLDENNQPQQLFPNAVGGYYIGYLTPGDANNRVLGANNVVPLASRGVALRYNGVELTDANVRNGTYTAWLYNRILKPQTGLTGTKLTFANALRDRIRDFDAPSGGGLFNDANFLVKRFTDGGLVVPK